MTGNATRYLQRGVALGLALLFCVGAHAQQGSQFLRDVLRQDLRGLSYMLIERDDTFEVIILGNGKSPARVLRIAPAQRAERLYELVDKGNHDAITALVTALDDPSFEVRSTAVRLLGEIDTVDARMALEPLLADPDTRLRLEVVEAIADSPGAGELLRIAALNDLPAVARTAREYLGESDNHP